MLKGLFKKSAQVSEVVVYSPAVGEALALEKVDDQVFSGLMMGPGAAVIPSVGEFFAPFDGEVMMIFPTKHAIGLKADMDLEVLVHIGLDTVELQGDGFTSYIKEGQKVKKGQKLMDVDLALLKEKGYKSQTPIIITNSDEFEIEVLNTEGEVTLDSPLLKITKKA